MSIIQCKMFNLPRNSNHEQGRQFKYQTLRLGVFSNARPSVNGKLFTNAEGEWSMNLQKN